MSEARRREWVGALVRERDRRDQLRWVRPTNEDEREEWYLTKMCEFVARLFDNPGWCPEPDCEENQVLQEAEGWLVEQGHTLMDPTELTEEDFEKIKAELRAEGYLIDGPHG